MALLDRIVLGVFIFALGYMLTSMVNAALVLTGWP
jgi:hypothetical protein